MGRPLFDPTWNLATQMSWVLSIKEYDFGVSNIWDPQFSGPHINHPKWYILSHQKMFIPSGTTKKILTSPSLAALPHGPGPGHDGPDVGCVDQWSSLKCAPCVRVIVRTRVGSTHCSSYPCTSSPLLQDKMWWRSSPLTCTFYDPTYCSLIYIVYR